ncbi:MAG: hypothetical protein ACTHU0_37620 [Kofleriaceae bacterium]
MTADVGFWETIVRDLGGTGHLRLIFQPLLAIIIGVRLGLADAREGRAPFLLRLFTTSQRGAARLREAFSDILLPFTFAVILDGILQHYTLGRIRPVAALLVGAMLVWLPFSLARAASNRLSRRCHRAHPAG